MARNNDLGNVRRSQVITTFGPGAIIDFAAGGPVSVVAAGLDAWDERALPAGLKHPQTTFEPRLQDRLKVKGFRLPPVTPQVGPGQPARNAGVLLGVRFPRWLQCPECHELKEFKKWASDAGDPAAYCSLCTVKAGGRRVYVVPVRFVMACENGHLDEFPWHFWVGHKPECKKSKPLKLKSGGKAGLAGLILSCTECGNSRPMEGCFSADVVKQCSGRRPWLPTNDTDCKQRPRVVLRGASNLYFPVYASALDIPPWSEKIQQTLGVYWEKLREAPPDQRLTLIELLKLDDELGMPAKEILSQVNTRIALLESGRTVGLRWEEYLQLSKGEMMPVDSEVEFELRIEKVPAELGHWIAAVGRVTRLREVRALTAFTRIKPPAGGEEEPMPLAPLSAAKKDWLPAVEVRGEGVFVRLNPDTLKAWEALPEVAARAAKLNAVYESEWQDRHGEGQSPPRVITPRLLLIHTLSHALMRQLSLDCGYSSASLRERLYVDSGERDMAGLLLYTATSDADGTLGGLSRQGESKRILEIFRGALGSMTWCSSDPLCIAGRNSLTESLNLAACHSCVHAPETSCEEFNRLLDRAMLIGTVDQPHVGYFRHFIDDLT